MMAPPEIVTFGCRLNAFESDIIRRAAGEAGLADAVIVNTCAVTAEAERQARQAIRRARRENPDGADHRHRLRRDLVAGALRRAARGRSGARQRGEAQGGELFGFRSGSPTSPRPLPLHGEKERCASRRDGARQRVPAPTSRCSRAATTAARSASSPTRAARAARCRCSTSSPGRGRWSRPARARSC